MKISVIGAGNIGGTLGKKWAAHGHDVVYGVRNPQANKVQTLLAEGNGAAARTVPEAVDGADVVLFAIPGRAMAETAALLTGRLNGKILVDATNNVGQSPMHSLDVLAQAAPGSPLFRAFNTLGWENFADPVIDGVQADLFYCGDGGAAQKTVQALISGIGLRPIYVGGPQQAGILDALTQLWFSLANQQGHGRLLAFKMLGS